jgi:hypothetical protein
MMLHFKNFLIYFIFLNYLIIVGEKTFEKLL